MNLDREHIYPSKFFGLIFLLSIPFWLFGAFISSDLLPGLPVSSSMVVCPMIAGAFLVWRTDGANALSNFFGRAVDFVDMRLWVWLVAAGTMPLAMLFSGLILIGSGRSLPAPEVELGQAVTLFALFLIAATTEELGWTGYVTQHLVEKRGLFVTGLIIGCVAATWHVIPLLQAGRGNHWIAWWAIGTIFRRV